MYNSKSKFENDSIYYDLEVNPQNYLKTLFYICSELEKMYNENKNCNDIKNKK